MKISSQEKKIKSNQLDKTQLDNIKNTNNNDIYSISNEINNDDIINYEYSKRNSNKFSFSQNNCIKNNSFLNCKKNRISSRKKDLIKDYNHKITINLNDDDNNINENDIFNNTDNFEVFNDKIIDIIKSDLFDYDINFEKDIKDDSKKNFWKNLIFRKFGGQNKLLLEIINDIKKYENIKHKNNNISVKTKRKKIIPENEYESIYDNVTVSQQKASKPQNRNNIIIIQLDDDDEEEHNSEEIIDKENVKEINDKEIISENNYKYDMIDKCSNDYFNKKLKLLLKIDDLNGLESESKFLRNFLYNENYFNENNIFFPEDFDDDEITNNIIEENNILRQTISLKLYALLKSVFPLLEDDIFQKNVTYLELLAYSIDKKIGNKYSLIIDIIFSRLREEVVKLKQRKIK